MASNMWTKVWNMMTPGSARNGFSGCHDRPANSIYNSFLINRFLLQFLESPRLRLRQGLQMLAKPSSEDFAAGLASGNFQDDVFLLLNRGHNLVTVQH